jgi:small subunit ribosomal protein S4
MARKLRKVFKRPRKVWDIALIEEGSKLMADYGLRRKKEILIAQEILRKYRRRARDLTAVKDKEKEKILLDKLVKLGVLEQGKGLDDVLALTVKNILERRLQTIVFRKGLASTAKHARQLIVHEKVRVEGRVAKFPSFLVTRDMETRIEVENNERKPKAAVPKPAAETKPAEAPVAGKQGDA